MSNICRCVTRRRFLQSTAAAGLGAAALVPASASGLQGTSAPSERLTMGFIGMGKQMWGHLGRMLGTPEVQVLAVCEVDDTRLKHALEIVTQRYSGNTEFKGVAAEKDFRKITDRKDIDAVMIATPDHWHAIPIIEACRNGKDVYCEKPLTLTIREAKLCIDVVRRYDRVFQTGSQQRSSSNFRYACELVRNGRIGKVQRVEVGIGGPSRWCDLPEEEMEPGLDWDRWLGPAPTRPYNSVLSPRGIHTHFPHWRHYREYSGGSMTDWGAHHFDIAQWGLGMDESGPVEIVPPDDRSAGSGVKYIYENGVEMIHGGPSGVTFHGTDGQIFVNRGKLSSQPESIIKEPIGADEVHLYESSGHHSDWLDCIKKRRRPICDVEVGARSVTVCHLGNLAYWYKRKLKWDPQKWEFVDDPQANGWRDVARRDGYQLPTI